MKRRIAAVVSIGALLLAGCGVIPSSSSTTSSATETTAEVEPNPPIQSAAAACGLADETSDEGMSITMDTSGKDDWDDDDQTEMEDLACFLNEVETPDYVVENIEGTRALDGQKTDTWGDFEARWTYHPDAGLKITIIDRS